MFLINCYKIRDASTLNCLDTWGFEGEIKLAPCHDKGGNQEFIYTDKYLIKNNEHCFESDGLNEPINLILCDRLAPFQKWFYDEKVFISIDFILT